MTRTHVARALVAGAGSVALMLSATAGGPEICEVAKLIASDGAADDWFGLPVAVSGDVAIAGSRRDDDHGTSSGSAYVYRRSGGIWVEEQKLVPADGEPGDHFGFGVGISGDVAIIGACGDNDNGTSAGSAYIYRFDGANWVMEQKLLASDGTADDHFGTSVDVDGDVALVGAFEDADNGVLSGSAYVYRFNGATWDEEQKLLPSDGDAGDEFAKAVAISGNVVVLGAAEDEDNGAGSGSAYVFRFNGAAWDQEQKLLASDGAANDGFGSSVSASGDAVAIGAPANDDNGNNSGSAYVFRFNGATWDEEQKILASDGQAGDSLGSSVAIAGDSLVVGAQNEDDNGSNAGAAYAHAFNGLTWDEVQKLLASDGAAGDIFGVAAASDGETAIIGASRDDDAGSDAGSAFLFDLTCGGPCVADITAASVTFGNNVGPLDPAKLTTDDNDRTIAQSRPFFSALEPHLTIVRVEASFACLGPATQITLTIQDHANQPGVINRAGLVPGGGGGLGIEVGSYGLSFNVDADHEIVVADGANFINPDTGDVKLDMRYSTLALLSPLGMEARTDLVLFVAE